MRVIDSMSKEDPDMVLAAKDEEGRLSGSSERGSQLDTALKDAHARIRKLEKELENRVKASSGMSKAAEARLEKMRARLEAADAANGRLREELAAGQHKRKRRGLCRCAPYASQSRLARNCKARRSSD